MALLQRARPNVTEDGRLVVPEGFQFTETEIHQTSSELLRMAEMSISNELQAPEEISTALRSYIYNEELRNAVNSAASDPNIFRAFLNNEHVNKFLATLMRRTRHAIKAYLGMNLNKIRIGHSEDSGHQQTTGMNNGNTSEVTIREINEGEETDETGKVNKDTRSVAEIFDLAKKQFTELLKRVWDFLCSKAGEVVMESTGFAFNGMGEKIDNDEMFQIFLILLLAIFVRLLLQSFVKL